jgi:excinuclease ABC subunit C
LPFLPEIATAAPFRRCSRNRKLPDVRVFFTSQRGFPVDNPLKLLRDKVRAGARNSPGIYRMMGASGVVLYVGKSKRLRTRLMGYFRARESEKAWKIMREAAGLEWEYTPSEFASLLRELELIKQLRPPFNVRSKRDGIYSFLKLSTGAAPKLGVVRRVNDEPGSYFGPFRGGQRMSEAVRELNDALLLRDCSRSVPIQFADQADLFGDDLTPHCPRYELRRCSAPCAAKCTESEYQDRVRQARAFLAGDADGPMQLLERRMTDAAERMEFEHAATLRRRLSRLEELRADFLRLRETVERLSFLYTVPGVEGEHRVYAVRSGAVRAVYPAPATKSERKLLLEQARAHFEKPEPPAEIAIRKRADEMVLLSHWFRTHPAELGRTYPLERWKELPLKGVLDAQALA